MDPMTRSALPPPKAGEAGFTLLESLVALALLAAGIALLQGGLAGAWRGQARAAGEIGALEVARAKLAAAGIDTPLTAGEREGLAEGGYRWRLTTRAETRSAAARAPGSAMRGYWTTVDVFWDAPGESVPRRVSLTALKAVQSAGAVP